MKHWLRENSAPNARITAEQSKPVVDWMRLELSPPTTPDASYMPLRIGDQVDNRFRIERLAGTGGMGHVFQAVDMLDLQCVAIKVMHRDHATTRERFARESMLLKEIKHQHIVRHIDDGFLPSNEPYLVMEWLEGETLGDRLTRGSLTPQEGLALGVLIADALGALHTRGIVHRDVKPQNVFLVDRDLHQPKLLDLGIAHVDAAARMTRTGALLGTLAYMAPEQARGDADIDARADVFALGCVLFECLTGVAPFAGKTMRELVSRILSVEAPLLRQYLPNPSEQLEVLFTQMLSKSRQNRPADGYAVVQSLKSLLDGENPIPSNRI